MILITGATELVGSYLALQLAEKGLNIKAIHPENDAIKKTKDLFDLYDKGHLFSKIIWICAEITDIPSLEIAFENVDFVYHCEGKISFNPRDEKILRKINIEGTANIVNFCLAKNVKKICFVSSIEALGDLTKNQSDEAENNVSKIINEETEWNPERANSDYAISKYGAEMEVWRGLQEGLDVIIVNPGVVLGPIPKSWNRNEGGFKIIAKVANGLKYYTQGSTGFVGVNDVVTCMIELMQSDVTGERYILVSENLTNKEITTLIAHSLQVAPPKKELKKWMSEWICSINWIKAHLFFQKRTFVKANVLWLYSTAVYSNQKIKSQRSFDFQPIATVVKEIAEKY